MSIGKNTSLCSADSDFQQLLKKCENCLTGRGNDCPGALPDDFVPSIQHFVNYCNNATGSGSNDDLKANALKIESLVKSNACLRSSVDDLRSYRSHSSTGAPPAATSARSSPLPPAAPSDGSAERLPGNIARTVVPAVVVPVVVLLIGLAILAYMLWRWRQRLQAKQAEVLEESAEAPEFGGKAQLPADPFRPELDGVDTAAGKEEYKEMDSHEVAELPAREAVGVEMDASGRHE
ncbi:uncharacterized protein BDW47DRAFT_54930 [Aspergillus candidus]|uniref:Uncharacterized protein n=1 Tax=Aspergillus candidus TaxID=41067 RepID=A0A2I2F607_ASPCN|nr:hypothetical protein BDW47DRAFT_54930 [Aspergillus candidus]PLB36075.1 hypothetical protein BDW47DRAFT_54930 [Aspergillus candidus]